MIALTSISPSKTSQELQLRAIKTWVDSGLKPFSLNTNYEIDAIKDVYRDVTFLENQYTLEKVYKKAYPTLNSFFDFIKKTDENCVIINSDIELVDSVSLLLRIEKKMQDNIIISHRHNYNDNKDLCKMHSAGFDLFYISKKNANIFKETKFVIGQCHYDYWIPYTSIKHNIPVVITMNKYAYHKHHRSSQYNSGLWQNTAIELIECENLPFQKTIKGMWQANDYVFQKIMNHAKYEMI